jgi:hypothetical protein
MQRLKSLNILLAGILLMGLILALEAALPENSRAAAPLPATVLMVQNDPTNPGLWAVWYDQTALLGDRAYLSHYGLEGSPFQVLAVPRSSALLAQSGFVFLPGSDPRYYYATYLPLDNSHNALESVAYQNLLNGQTTRLAANLDLSICRQDSWPLTRYLQHTLVYNPDLNRIYLPCFADTATKQAALVIDPTGDKIVGSLPYVPLAYNPVSHRLISLKYYPDPSSYFYGEDFDLLTLDSRTEQPANDPPLIANHNGGAGLTSLLVNNRTGEVYLTRYMLSTKTNGVFQAAFDRDNRQTQDWSATPLAGFLSLNEATNQLYGKHYNGTYIAVNAANLMGGQLASFGWTPLAANYQYNWVYSIENHDSNSPFFSSRGMGIVIMDGHNFDITNFFPVRPPDIFFSQYGNRLPERPQNLQGLFFQETGHSLSGKFLEYWQANGGLALFGFPLTEPFLDFNQDDGLVYQVQYFERNRFEYHPENAGTPYEVELGLLGKAFSAIPGPEITAHYGTGETAPIPGGLLFKETGHTLTGKFLDYWQHNGGLAMFGLPLTEPFSEYNLADGQTYQVQYFERNRFEYHPANAGTPYEVELGLLGSQYLRARGWFR